MRCPPGEKVALEFYDPSYSRQRLVLGTSDGKRFSRDVFFFFRADLEAFYYGVNGFRLLDSFCVSGDCIVKLIEVVDDSSPFWAMS